MYCSIGVLGRICIPSTIVTGHVWTAVAMPLHWRMNMPSFSMTTKITQSRTAEGNSISVLLPMKAEINFASISGKLNYVVTNQARDLESARDAVALFAIWLLNDLIERASNPRILTSAIDATFDDFKGRVDIALGDISVTVEIDAISMLSDPIRDIGSVERAAVGRLIDELSDELKKYKDRALEASTRPDHEMGINESWTAKVRELLK
jgi:hypothetical protein